MFIVNPGRQENGGNQVLVQGSPGGGAEERGTEGTRKHELDTWDWVESRRECFNREDTNYQRSVRIWRLVVWRTGVK